MVLFFPAPVWTQNTADRTGAWNRERLLSAALRGNSAFRLAESQGREARSVLSAAKASRLPVIRFSSNLSYLTNPPGVTIKAGSLYPGGTITAPSLPVPVPIPALPDQDTTLSLGKKTHYEFSLSLEQPVFTWGRIHNSVKAADLGNQASALRLEQEERNIRTMLDVHLFTLSYLAEIREVLAEQRRSAGRLIVISEESYANGFLLQADLLSSRLLSAEVALGDYDIREAWDSSFLAIKTLTGITELEPSGLLLPPPDHSGRGSLGYSRDDKPRLFARIKAGNPGLKLLSIQTQVTEKTLAAAKGQSYGKPELGLFLQFSYAGPAFPFVESGWQADNSGNFTATLGIRSLLFDGGGMHQTIRRKEEGLVQARLEEERGLRDLEEFLEKTLHQLEVSRYRQEYLALKIEASAAQKTQAETAWRNGYGEEREFLAQELSWYQDRIALLREELAALVTALQLENLLGEPGEG
ncbi:MAG: TolC family protein [Treponema sp.]|nr:TolC family protein [Treponema sp.]